MEVVVHNYKTVNGNSLFLAQKGQAIHYDVFEPVLFQQWSPFKAGYSYKIRVFF